MIRRFLCIGLLLFTWCSAAKAQLDTGPNRAVCDARWRDADRPNSEYQQYLIDCLKSLSTQGSPPSSGAGGNLENNITTHAKNEPIYLQCKYRVSEGVDIGTFKKLDPPRIVEENYRYRIRPADAAVDEESWDGKEWRPWTSHYTVTLSTQVILLQIREGPTSTYFVDEEIKINRISGEASGHEFLFLNGNATTHNVRTGVCQKDQPWELTNPKTKF